MTSTIRVDRVEQGPAASGITFAHDVTVSGTISATNSYLDWSSSIQTASFTAVSGKGYFVNTSSAELTVTLPASPAQGDRVGIIDVTGSADSNKITIARNSNNINSGTSDLYMIKDRQAVALIYSGSTNGWIVENDGNSDETALSGSYSADVMVIGGGGSGAAGFGNGNGAGGGGAGGFQVVSQTLIEGKSYTATVGAGGAVTDQNRGSQGGGQHGLDGEDSVFNGTTSIGGGGGGSPSTGGITGNDGGSGGGGGSTSGSGGSGTSGQGNAGGDAGGSSYYRGGGGGGAGAAGSNGGGGGAAGGAGTNSYSAWATATSTGVSGYYAGGGGGGDYNGNQSGGSGGSGGGGAGGSGTGNASSATANTGSGGGGGGSPSTGSTGGKGGAGGSGLIIIRYSGDQRGTGGTVVSSGGYTYHTFTSSGTYTG